MKTGNILGFLGLTAVVVGGLAYTVKKNKETNDDQPVSSSNATFTSLQSASVEEVQTLGSSLKVKDFF